MLVEKMQVIVLCVGISFACIEYLISISPLLMRSSSVQIFCKRELMQDTRNKEREFLKLCCSCLVGDSQALASTEAGNHMVSVTNTWKILL